MESKRMGHCWLAGLGVALLLVVALTAAGCATTASCQRYCDLMATHCAGQQSGSVSTCERTCRSSGWPVGIEGADFGNSLSCRISWAQAAEHAPYDGCPAASALSTRCCTDGRCGPHERVASWGNAPPGELPASVSLPPRAADPIPYTYPGQPKAQAPPAPQSPTGEYLSPVAKPVGAPDVAPTGSAQSSRPGVALSTTGPRPGVNWPPSRAGYPGFEPRPTVVETGGSAPVVKPPAVSREAVTKQWSVTGTPPGELSQVWTTPKTAGPTPDTRTARTGDPLPSNGEINRPRLSSKPRTQLTGRCVVGLFDGADAWGKNRGAAQRARRTLKGRVGKALRQLKLKLRVHDLRRGLPGAKTLGNCRGIVAVFEDYDLQNAEAFNTWLAARIDEGRNVVLLNTYGALRESSVRTPLGPESANEVFERLGVRYTGLEWNAAEDLRPGKEGQDRDVFTAAGPANPRAAGHLRVFADPAPDVVVHQWVSFRNPYDQRVHEVPVVFTSPRGGMVLVRYFEDVSGKTVYVDLRAFLAKAGLGD